MQNAQEKMKIKKIGKNGEKWRKFAIFVGKLVKPYRAYAFTNLFTR